LSPSPEHIQGLPSHFTQWIPWVLFPRGKAAECEAELSPSCSTLTDCAWSSTSLYAFMMCGA